MGIPDRSQTQVQRVTRMGGVLQSLLRFVSRPVVAVPLLILLPLVAPISMAIRYGIAVPAIHDERAQLLMASTFSLGRLTNPAHPMWPFFESFHVIQQPSYMGKYPPGPALFMALGAKVVSFPLAGEWLAASLASLAAWWALRSLFGKTEAFVGAAVLATHPLLAATCGNYFGGPVAALGGALVVGGVLHGVRRPGVIPGLGLGVGLALLALSRPAEGLVLFVVSAGLALVLLHPRWRRLVARGMVVAATAGAVLVPVGIWMLYYNYRVTGHPTQMPYVLHEKHYSSAPLFAWQDPAPPPVYRHEVLASFHQGPEFAAYRTLWSWYFIPDRWDRILKMRVTALPFPLALGAIACLVAFRRSPIARFGVLALIGAVLAMQLETFYSEHYLCAVLILVAFVAAAGIAWCRHALPKAGNALAGALAITFIVAGMIQCYPAMTWVRDTWKEHYLAQLADKPGRHLVFIHWSEHAIADQDWLYNEPNTDASRVVWARDMGERNNAILLHYYPDRKAWLCDDTRLELTEYPKKIQ